MREGIKTTEFWLALLMVVLTAIQKQLWPEAPISSESFIVVVTWIISRLGEKVLSEAIAERAWATTEFWVAIGFAVIKYVFPALPEQVLPAVMAYVIGRPAVKAAKDIALNRIGRRTINQ